MDLGQPLAFSSEDKVPANVCPEIDQLNVEDDEFEWYFDIASVAHWIENGNFINIALQFPDNMLKYAAKVSMQLESLVQRRPFILADTSYGSCCVDEIAAEHVNADSIVHFGDACKSKLHDRIPVKYVLPKTKLDIEQLERSFRHWKSSDDYKTLFNNGHSLLIVMDLNYLHLEENLTNMIRTVFGEHVPIYFEMGYDLKLEEKSIVLYIGCTTDSIRLTLLMMSNPAVRFYTYHTQTFCIQQENIGVNRLLKKRLYLIEKAKDAKIIGIVIGTLSLANYLAVLDRLKALCKNCCKTYYVLSVGKLNVAKLSNFAEVDVFVMLACPYNIIFDSSDYYRPILSPFEFEIACNPSKNWVAGSGWSPDFSSILTDELLVNKMENDTDLSLLTGKLRNLNYSEM